MWGARHNIDDVVDSLERRAELAERRVATQVRANERRVLSEVRGITPRDSGDLAAAYYARHAPGGAIYHNPLRYAGHVHDGRHAAQVVQLVQRLTREQLPIIAREVTHG